MKRAWQNFINFHLPVLIFITLVFFLSEKINIGNGFGMDGQTYGAIATDFLKKFSTINIRYIQRCLPSGIIYIILTILGIPKNNPNIINSFIILNIISIGIVIYLWIKIAEFLNMSYKSKWFGIISLIGNYAILKWSSYYPVLTDIPSYALGMSMVYFYLTNRPYLQLIIAAIGIFTFPLCAYFSLLLILYPRHIQIKYQKRVHRNFANQVFVGGVAVSLVLINYLIYNKIWSFSTFTSILISLTYIYLSYYYLSWSVGSIVALKYIFRIHQKLSVSVLAILTISLIIFLQNKFAISPVIGVTTLQGLLQNLSRYSITHPGVFITSHLIFFGPVLFYTIFLWKIVGLHINKNFGFGAILFIGLGILLSLDSESRHLFFIFPFIVTVTVKELDSQPHLYPSFYLFLFTSFWLSKLWLSIGNIVASKKDVYPDLLFYMHLGPWMLTPFYYMHLGVCILIGYLFYSQMQQSLKVSHEIKS